MSPALLRPTNTTPARILFVLGDWPSNGASRDVAHDGSPHMAVGWGWRVARGYGRTVNEPEYIDRRSNQSTGVSRAPV